MCLSAHFRINLTANPSSVDLTVSSQPYATHQTQTRTKRERYQNQHHGDPTKVKNCNEFLPHFCLPDKFCAPTSWKTVITKGRHKKTKQAKHEMKSVTRRHAKEETEGKQPRWKYVCLPKWVDGQHMKRHV